MKTILTIFIIIIVVIFGLLVVSNNLEVVKFNFIIAEVRLMTSALIILCFIAGFIVSWLVYLFPLISLKIKLNSNKKIIQKLLKENENLKINNIK